MTRLAAFLALTGFLLMFGAVGGMDDPDQAEYFVEQALAAMAGAIMMLAATKIEVDRDE
jgi:peptidoglycan/LPS O-acetylase OafA/YrhL